MIPDGVSAALRASLLKPDIIVPPLVWLTSTEADGITGRRFVATRWRTDCSSREAAEAAME